MINAKLIARLRLRHVDEPVGRVKLDNDAADALEAADKRIAEDAQEIERLVRAHGMAVDQALSNGSAWRESERKLAIAREALRYAGDEPNLDRARRIADAALAQIGGEE